jgi:hypothetical protein
MNRHLLLFLLAACAPGTEPLLHDSDRETWWLAEPAQPPPTSCPQGIAAFVDGTTHTTIQGALDASASYDNVVICPGTWTEALSVPHAGPIAITGATGDPDDVVLDGQLTRQILSIRVPGSWVRLGGVTLGRGYSATGGAALDVSAGAGVDNRLHLYDVIVADNQSDSGGAIDFPGRVARFDRVQFLRFRGDGEALRLSDIYQTQFRAEVRDCLFEDNEGLAGAAIYADLSQERVPGVGLADNRLIIQRTQFLYNTATYTGGALDVSMARSRLRIEDSLFVGNSADHLGGAIYLHHMDAMSQVEFLNVEATDNVAWEYGSAFFLTDGAVPRGSATALIRGGRYARNLCINCDHDNMGAITAHNVTWQVYFDDVDLGSGADDNNNADVGECPYEYGAGTTGIYDDPYGCIYPLP